MKQGDLICYNSAGQTNKTLGLVIETEWVIKSIGASVTRVRQVLIMWCCTSDIMPRKLYRDTGVINQSLKSEWSRNSGNTSPGEISWYENSNWFKVI